MNNCKERKRQTYSIYNGRIHTKYKTRIITFTFTFTFSFSFSEEQKEDDDDDDNDDDGDNDNNCKSCINLVGHFGNVSNTVLINFCACLG